MFSDRKYAFASPNYFQRGYEQIGITSSLKSIMIKGLGFSGDLEGKHWCW